MHLLLEKLSDRGESAMLKTCGKITIILPTLAALIIWCGSARAATSYTLNDLGTLIGSNATQAWDINSIGQVVGRSYNTVSPAYTEFLWSNGSMQSLNITVTAGSIPGINDNGQVVGDGYNNHAFLRNSDGSMRDLGTLTGGSSSSANGINNNGMVVGISDVLVSGAIQRHAFAWTSADGMQDLGSLGGVNTMSSARRINDAGKVVGYYMGTDSKQHAFIWSQATGMQDLGVLGNGSMANGINNNGQVVGESNGGFGSFFWSESTGSINLKTFGANRRIYAYDINSSGQIVGYGSPAPGSGDRAVLWNNYDSAPVDLNTLYPDAMANGWILSEATGINDKGEITGWMRQANGSDLHAFVLNPVPLPPPLLLFGSGLAGLGVFRRKAKGRHKNL
jgi:probable HAF family extracellular repeat protein